MNVKTVKITSLKPHPRNPRQHPEGALNKLVKSIKEFGWTNPVLVSKDGYVLAGHARLKAAEKAGLTEVPVIYLDLEGAKADAYLIADNKIQELTDWDLPALKDILQDLDDGQFDLTLTGFDEKEIEQLMTQFNPGDGEQGEQGVVIQYNIIFDDEQQQESWFKFIKWLKAKYPEAETIAQRLQIFIESLDLHVKV